MTERNDLEELLRSNGGGTADDGPELETQRRIHRLLRATVAQRPAPELSAGFEAALSRRLRPPRQAAAKRPLAGWRRIFMVLYWAALALAVVWLAPPLPTATPLSIAIWSALVPASYLPLVFPRRFKTALRRLAPPLFT